MTRPLTFRYDPEAGAVYIYVGGTGFRIAQKTVALADDVMVDLDQHGKLIGVEILNVAEPRTDIIGTRPGKDADNGRPGAGAENHSDPHPAASASA